MAQQVTTHYLKALELCLVQLLLRRLIHIHQMEYLEIIGTNQPETLQNIHKVPISPTWKLTPVHTQRMVVIPMDIGTCYNLNK